MEMNVYHTNEFEATERINAEIRLQAELDSADNIEEEEEEEEELPQAQETRNPSLFPSEPVACIFVMMLMMMHGKYLTQEGCENEVPKNFYKGITKYVSCKACHSIYHLSENNDTQKRRSHCTFATHISSVTRRTLQTCDTDYTQSPNLANTTLYVFTSIIQSLLH
ncbi:hypothetical protein BD770DRAFT_449551 [Pilaira anomala]|nr:hypothetical protein BD770DRAFT_449551 [Pilaira anomala]